MKKIFLPFLAVFLAAGLSGFAAQSMTASGTSAMKNGMNRSTMKASGKATVKFYGSSFDVSSISALGSMKTIDSNLILNPAGGRLVMSDSPAGFAFNYGSSSEAFYQDLVSGQFRVYMNTQNIGTVPATVGFALTNTTNQPVELYRIAKGSGISPLRAVAGQTAIAKLFMVMKKTFVETLKPGESLFVGNSVGSGDFFSAVGDYLSLTPDRKPATLTVTTLAYSGKKPLEFINIPGVESTSGKRGAFPFFIRTGTVAYNAMNGREFVSLGNSGTGVKGEYETGRNLFSGVKINDKGNFGVVYNLRFIIRDSGMQKIGIYLIPGTGSGRYVTMFNMMKLLKSGFLSHEEAWKLADVTVGGTAKLDFLTSLPMGSSGPVRIAFVPEGK